MVLIGRSKASSAAPINNTDERTGTGSDASNRGVSSLFTKSLLSYPSCVPLSLPRRLISKLYYRAKLRHWLLQDSVHLLPGVSAASCLLSVLPHTQNIGNFEGATINIGECQVRHTPEKRVAASTLRRYSLGLRLAIAQPGPPCPYSPDRTLPDATMKRVDAPSNLDKKESDGRDPR